MMTTLPNPDLAQGLRRLRDRLAVRLRERSHGKLITELDAAGTPREAGGVVTVQKLDSESVESFIVRVWTEFKPLPHTSIEWSTHDGRLTAKITTRPPNDDDNLRRELAELRQQVARLAAYLAKIDD